MNPPPPYDRLYKRLFSYPEVIGELIEAFLPEGLAELCELDTLERVEGSFITPAMRARESDLVWSVALRGQPSRLYLYLLLEFQSTSDAAMPVRMLQYVAAFLGSLVERKRTLDGRLPPVLPVVLYNGDVPWQGATSVEAMRVEGVPEVLRAWQPRLRFHLIDQTQLPAEALDRDHLLSLLFAIEQREDFEGAKALIRRIGATLKAGYAHRPELARGLVELMLAFFDKRYPGFQEGNTDIGDFDMLATRVAQWEEQAVRKGMRLGREEGLREGRLEGEAQVLRRLLARRFGPLPEWVEARLRSAGEAELEAWAEAVLDARSLEEVFGQ